MAARWILAASLILWAFQPHRASAQDAADDPRVETARQIFDRGEAEFAGARYGAAARSFEESWTIMHDQISPPHPNAYLIRYEWGRALEQAGETDRAVEIYNLYLDEGGRSGEHGTEVEGRIAALRARPRAGISPVGPIILAVGGAAAIAGAITGGLALSEGDALRAECPSLTGCRSELQDRFEAMRLMAGAADVLLFSGLAIATLGLVLTFTLTEGSRPERAALGVHLGANHLGLDLSGSF